MKSRDSTNPPRVRLPITLQVLIAIKQLWERDGITHDMWAAATLCFFGFFRSGEITVPSVAAFNPTVHVTWGDVTFDNSANPSSACMKLKRSKCDQFGAGVNVHLGQTGSPLCPIAALLAYIASRRDTPGPFFRDTHGNPLTKGVFVRRICRALTRLGFPAAQFAGHSFRIGAATAAVEAGLEDSAIQSLGCWSSSAFLLYIRTPKNQLARFTSRIANARQFRG